MKKFIYTIIAMLGILMPTSAWAAEDSYREAYVVLELTQAEDGTVTDSWLTLYYDDLKSTRKGTVVDLDKMQEEPNIMQAKRSLHSVIIDQSFADCRPTSTKGWFAYCMQLKTIAGMEYLNTSEVTDMDIMFMECAELEELDLSHFNTSKVTTMSNMFFMNRNLKTLDLSSFDTSNVTDMSYMFAHCSNLTTILVGDKWSTNKVTEGDYMFGECTSIVGGNGTKFDENHTDPSYARVDKEGQPGYFTQGSGSSKTEQVATPTWEFQGELLILSTKPADANIYYALANWDDETKTDSIANALEVSERSTKYTAPIEITDNIVIKMMAAKEGMENSKDTTFVYDYKSWSQLYDVIRYGVEIAEKATDNPKVEQSLVEELRWALNEGDHMYQMRAEVSSSEAEYFTVAIMEACKKIEEQLNATDGQAETPKIEFREYNMILTSATEGATIYYAIKKFDNSLNADSISSYVERLAVSVDSTVYTEPIVADYDLIIKTMAVKEGMENSKDTTFVYYFTEWQGLIDLTYECSALMSQIEASKPSDYILALIQRVAAEIAYIRDTYESDRLSWDRNKILDEREKLRMYTLETEAKWKEESANATYEGTVLTVNGQTTMDAALEQVGGRAEVAKNIAAIVWNSSASLSKSDLEGLIDNPNLLIYVKTDSIAPEGVNNVVIDGKAKSITLVDTDGNNNFYAPQAFTVENISYTREFKQTTQKDVSRGWEGICLPFDVQTYTHETHGAIAPFRNDASEFHFWLHLMSDKGMTIATNIEANKPYIISMPNSSAYAATYNQAGKVTFAAKNVTIENSIPWMIHNSDGSIGVAGNYTNLEKNSAFYALNVGEEVDGNLEGSVFVSNYRVIRPFEVYTYHTTRSSGSRVITVSSLFGGGSDDSTGIIDVMENQNGEVVKVYSISGSLIKQGNRNEVMNSLPKGLYIIGNQKIMVK